MSVARNGMRWEGRMSPGMTGAIAEAAGRGGNTSAVMASSDDTSASTSGVSAPVAEAGDLEKAVAVDLAGAASSSDCSSF